jgi:hypothetical protein
MDVSWLIAVTALLTLLFIEPSIQLATYPSSILSVIFTNLRAARVLSPRRCDAIPANSRVSVSELQPKNRRQLLTYLTARVLKVNSLTLSCTAWHW